MPARLANWSAPSRDVIVPAPMLSLPGLAFAFAMSSLIVLGPSLRTTTSATVLISNEIGAKSLSGSYGRLGVTKWVEHHGRVHRREQRISVGRRTRRRLRADRGIAAGAVLDQHRLTPILAHPLSDHSRDHVGRAAGRERHDDPDRSVGVVVRRRAEDGLGLRLSQRHGQ